MYSSPISLNMLITVNSNILQSYESRTVISNLEYSNYHLRLSSCSSSRKTLCASPQTTNANQQRSLSWLLGLPVRA